MGGKANAKQGDGMVKRKLGEGGGVRVYIYIFLTYFFNSRNKRIPRRQRQSRKSDVGCSQTSTKRTCVI